MRIPKFRAWDKETKTMRQVEAIYFNKQDEITNVLLNMGFVDIKELRTWNSIFAFKDVELMQSTGLYDVIGVEIFENDIIKDKTTYNKYIVVFEDGHYLAKHYKQSNSKGLNYWIDEFEVIGNIFENKELLESEV